MRTFSALFAAATLALTANAAVIQTGEVTAPVLECVSAIANIEKVLDLVDLNVSLLNIVDVNINLGNLDTGLAKADATCGKITDVVSDVEAAAVLKAVKPTVSKATTLIGGVLEKKDSLLSGLLGSIQSSAISGIISKTESLTTTLLHITPTSYLSTAQGLVKKVTTTYETTKEGLDL
ncbi:hypothetical protein A0J61_07818 [Choanephora cucurbitarum]|uniref:Uncharacterized protein n=1 Tax=Choanephora cucurbitarum TaxID=101091 RepID=A0A1C7N692_9FUNG|nr:hypothetical protein A0J61_07818 [Choanephora cucurbitarum]